MSRSRHLWVLPTVLLVLHSVLTFSGVTFWGDFGMPLLLVWAGFSLLSIARGHKTEHRSALFFMLGIWIYASADILWVILDRLTTINPDENLFLSFYYVLPNIMFLVAILLFLLRNRHRWHKIQLGLDILTVSTVTLISMSHLFLEKQLSFSIEQIPSYLYLALDTTAITLIITVLVSSRQKKIWNRGLVIVLLALFFYMIADGIYISGVINQTYVPNGFVDWLFITSLVLIAAGVKTSFSDEAHLPSNSADQPHESQSNEGPFWSAAWIVLLPVFSIVLNGVHLTEMLYYAVMLVLYLIASLYVQNSIAVERTLAERTEHNTALKVLVTERTAQLQTIQHMNQHDALTNLLSRQRFLELVDYAINPKNNPYPLYLVILDIARFRNINQLYGQDVGDQVLVQTARRITENISASAWVARLGGNEFAILFHDDMTLDLVRSDLQRLIAAFETPVEVEPFLIRLQIHLGLASSPEHAGNQSELMQCALTAVEQAKKLKWSEPYLYNKSTHQQLLRRQEVEMALRHAELDREFYLVYQPQYDVTGKQLTGMEALVRWDSLSLPGIGPAEFIPVAEETGYILKIGRWVMRKAMQQIRQWNILNHSSYQMGINISALQVEDPGFIVGVQKTIQETGVKPEWLNFEVTETAAMGTPEQFGSVLKELSLLGASVSIDDFGTGYSSYAYLKRYAIDYLKIDKALIQSMAVDSTDSQIIQAIIAMTKALNIQTVAEGVETADQAKLLDSMGCEKIQGYLYGRPEKPEAFERLHLNK